MILSCNKRIRVPDFLLFLFLFLLPVEFFIAESIVFNDERIGVLEGILAIEHVVLGEYFIVDKRDEEMIPGGLGFNCSYADPSNVAQEEYPEMAKRLTNETTDENPSESITFKSKSKGKTVHFRIETEARTAVSVS